MIYIHIGLHKTATTSLQKTVFPYLGDILYVGRGRKGGNDQIYDELVDYCFRKTSNAEVKSLIQKKLQNIEGDLLISDEWFTSDYSGLFFFEGCSWQSKIERLSELVNDIECKVLVTLREPVEGLYSQYCEFLTVGLKKKYKSFEDYTKSNDAKVYDYVNLDSFLKKKFHSVNYLSFEDIVNGKYKKILGGFFNVEEVAFIQHKNSRVSTDNSIELKSNSLLLMKLAVFMPKQIKVYLKKSDLIMLIKKKLHEKIENTFKVPRLNEHQREIYGERFKSSGKFYRSLQQ